MPKIVVSTPAESRARTSRVACSGAMRPSSATFQMSAPRPVIDRFSRAQLSMIHAATFSPSVKASARISLSAPKALKAIAP